MASKVQMPAVATTPWVACFLAEIVKSNALAMPKYDACETYAAVVVRTEEGTKMIFGLGGPQPRALRVELPIEVIFSTRPRATFGRVPQTISPRAEQK
jgi:hypothetical protein